MKNRGIHSDELHKEIYSILEGLHLSVIRFCLLHDRNIRKSYIHLVPVEKLFYVIC